MDAEDATPDGDDLCVPGTLDPAMVEGAIVLCRRGEIARVDKSSPYRQAGGVGMIMYENSDSGDRFTDNHYVPSVHVDNTPGLAIKAYIDSAGGTTSGGGKGKGGNGKGGNGKGKGNTPDTGTDAGPTATIVNTGVKGTFSPAPSMTSFSSRGPDPVAMDLIKPDVTAPGMQILAGASPYADPNGNDFQSIAGTSMSSPHVAGLFALIDQAHPHWSPAVAKSALMTSARQDVVDNDRSTPATPFDMGAGHVAPGSPSRLGSAFEPGIAYDATFEDYLGFLCDAAPEALSAATCSSLAADGVPTTATDLNVPSIGASAVPGTLTVTRRVTGTSGGAARTWTADVDVPDGFEVTVSPSTFSIRKGQTVEYTVTIRNTSAPVGAWRHGSLTWTSGTARAYSPMSVRAAALNFPDTIRGAGVDGSTSFDVEYGYSGTYTAAGHGLTAARVEQDDVPFDEDQTFHPATSGPAPWPTRSPWRTRHS